MDMILPTRNMGMLKAYLYFMLTVGQDHVWRDNSSMKRQKNMVFGSSPRIVPEWGIPLIWKTARYAFVISELADSLDIGKFGVMGWSEGGAHTTVCGYAIPKRLLFNFSFAGYTNFAELPEAEKYLKTKMDQVSVGLSKTHPKLFKLFFDLMEFSEKRMPKSYFKALMKEVAETDRKIAEDEGFHKLFMEDQAEAFKQGSKGVTMDAAVHYVDWGFRLKDIPVKLNVFHGTKDTMVPFEYGKHIAENVPNCTFHAIENEGHFFPYRHLYEIFDFAKKEAGI